MDTTNLVIPANANAILMLADGKFFFGRGVGHKSTTLGEICFNTSLTGYQEILTDTSYTGQIINFTFPHIGNVGTNRDDFESKRPAAKGLILRNPVTPPSNYRNEIDFRLWLEEHKMTGITGIDTRALTKYIRENGAQNCGIIYKDTITNSDIKELYQTVNSTKSLEGMELAASVTCATSYDWQEHRWNVEPVEAKYNIAVVDFGIKHNILRCLVSAGCKVTVFSAEAEHEEIMSINPDGVLLSNGPGDPAATGKYAIPMIKKLIEGNVPIFGICLGHQLLGLALGARTKKMFQGHRGANHPIKNLINNRVEITSQNHGFVVDEDSLPDDVIVSHRSLFDNTIEGIAHKTKPIFSVQYHPESSPGPHDSYYLYDKFLAMAQARKNSTVKTTKAG